MNSEQTEPSEFNTEHLPLLTADLPGISGTLKTHPEDFTVDEIPAYAASGDGEHLFLWIEKRGVAADELTRHLSRTLDISPGELGTAGLKDKQAVTRQFVSVPRRAAPRLSAIDSDNIRLLSATPHRHKLRTAHLRGNRFRVLVRDVCEPAAFEKAKLIADRLRSLGIPNYFGEQRFGRGGTTVRLGFDLLRGTAAGKSARPQRFLKRLAISAAQAWLFNDVLAQRLRDGLLHRVLSGDVMQVVASGGLFWVDDVEAEQRRYGVHETVLTGPMFGPKMKPPRDVAAQREQLALECSQLTLDHFRGFCDLASGTRRSLLIWPSDLTVQSTTDGLLFEFVLPAGAYATVLLREFLKLSASGDHDGGHEEH